MLHFSRCLQCLFQGQASVKQRKAWDAAARSVALTTTKVGEKRVSYSVLVLANIQDIQEQAAKPQKYRKISEVVPFCCSSAESSAEFSMYVFVVCFVHSLTVI